ncbi:MAG: hypothetical protein P8J86_07945 [Phycisphaerales bacterium]|nr:hypothetical protein [Phycisphaerales bacterium]
MRTIIALCVCVIGSLFIKESTLAHEIGLGFNQVVHTSDAVFVGRVASINGTANKSGFISTEIVFEQVSPIVARSSAQAYIGEKVKIRFGGGTAGGVSLSMCCAPKFEIGQEYLIFSQLDDGQYLNPFSGGRQGVFPIAYDRGGNAYPLTYGYQGIDRISRTRLHLTAPVISLRDGVPEYRMVSEHMHTQAPFELDGNGVAQTHVEPTPRKLVTLQEMVVAISEIAQQQTPVQVEKRSGKRPKFGKAQRLNQQRPVGSVFDRADRMNQGIICYCGDVGSNITMEQVPESWTSWAQNNNIMYRFNQQVDVFTYSDDDGGWDSNFEDEFCGWATSAQVASAYGSGWSWGASAIAVCWTTDACGCCNIAEADIMHNPAFSWRYDLDDVIGTSNILYRPTTRHELGHALGLERGNCAAETYAYNQPCSMTAHWSGSVVEDGRGLHALDVLALRALYPDESIEDVGVESYYASTNLLTATLSATLFDPGDSFDIDNITVENLSSNSQSSIRVRVYLSSNKNITESDYEIAEFSFGTINPGKYWTGDLNGITIPNTSSTAIPGGTYYVGLIATLDGDDYWWDECSVNNATYIPTQITVGDYVPSYTPGLAVLINFDWLYARYHVNNANSPGNGGDACGEELTGSVWHYFVAPHAGKLSLSNQNDEGESDESNNNFGANFAGNLCNDVIEVYEGFPDIGSSPIGQGCRSCEEPVVAYVAQGQTYYVRIGGINGAPVNGIFNLEIEPYETIGDRPDLARPIVHEPMFGNLEGLTTTFGPVCAQSDIIDAWYRYEAPAHGLVRASTCDPGTQIDTTIAVFNTQVSQLFACNDNTQCSYSGSEKASTAIWGAEAGQVFLIRVAGTPGALGAFTLNVEPVADQASNTTCQGAFSAGSDHKVPFSTWGAAVPGDLVSCEGNRVGCGVWIKWASPESGRVAIGTSVDIGGSSSIDAALAIFDACGTSKDPVACSIDASNTGQPIAYLDVIQGDSYFIYIGSDFDMGCLDGSGILSIEYQEQEICVGDATGDSIVNLDDFSQLLIEYGATGESSADFNGDLVVDLEDFSLLLINYGNICPS